MQFDQAGLLPDNQCGFRNEAGPMDMILARRLQDKCQEQNTDICMTYVDIPKLSVQSVVIDFGKQ